MIKYKDIGSTCKDKNGIKFEFSIFRIYLFKINKSDWQYQYLEKRPIDLAFEKIPNYEQFNKNE